MIRTREQLEEASEKDFCLEFLIPLFKALGFKDVTYHHGGNLERGKDIVMWKEGDFTPRVNYAVVSPCGGERWSNSKTSSPAD